jgi:Sulfotransferase family
MPPSRNRFGSGANRKPSKRCLVFLHVPKTGGQTIESSLPRNFPKSERIYLDTLDRPLDEAMNEIPLERRLTARLVWGHIPHGVHLYMPQRCEYFTILREPIARVVSVYKYIIRTPEHALHDRLLAEAMSLEEYLETGIDEGQTENSQTRQLSGRQFDALDRDALETAKRNLEACLVGLTERFEETFVLLRRTFGLRMPFYHTTNVSPPYHVSERAVELARERNELDLELYGFACDVFAAQLDCQDRSFGPEVSAYRALRPLSRAAITGRVLRKLERLHETHSRNGNG